MGVSPALEEDIRARVAWLESFYPGIGGGHTVVAKQPTAAAKVEK
jgi:hypothetical protein